MEQGTLYFQDMDYAPGSVGDVFRLIRGGHAQSRSTLARAAGLAPSTAGLRVDTLLQLGLLKEDGEKESEGGRRARRLQINYAAGYVAALDVGSNHANITITDLGGRVLAESRRLVVIADGPETVVAWLWEQLQSLISATPELSGDLMGIAVGLPAAIQYPSGRVVLPYFMPTWHNAVVPSLFAEHTSVPVLVENDANLIALAEQAPNVQPQLDQLLALELGARIGCGILSSGRLHRGVSGAAGEISHTPVTGTPTISCTCGLASCLEAVASGKAVVARLRGLGYNVEIPAQVVELGETADARVAEVLRDAGTEIGRVLAPIVNFFNPRTIVLGGTMSASAPLVAAFRAEVFQRCLPLVSNDLEIRAVSIPKDAAVRGASRLILEEILAPARIQLLADDYLKTAQQNK